jgi:LuxR family maltose regulon positive regulatory protein
MPEDVVAARPQLALSVAMIVGAASRPPAEARHWLSLIDEDAGIEPGPLGFSSIQAAAQWLRAHFFDDIGTALLNAQQLVKQEVDPGTLSYAFVRVTLGETLYFAGRSEEARAPLEEVLRAPLLDQQQGLAVRSLAHLALICLDQGDTEQAEELVRRSLQLAEDAGQSEYAGLWFNYLVFGQVLFRRGLVEEAELVLERGLEGRLPDLRTWPYEYAFALLALAPVRFARGHARAAEALLSEARAVIATCPDPGMLPARLQETERLLHRLPRRPTGLLEELSEAELRVLRVLPSDLSNREIGRELYLSVNTIRTHIRSIYGKLGVASRRDAVARARTLGLIA